jgi:nucleoside-diphosphate-sugar epimerase
MTKGIATVGARSTVLIAGFGDIGERVARLLSRSRRVMALIRNPDRQVGVAGAGAQPSLGDLDDVASLGAIAGLASTVFHFAPPPNSGADDPRTANLLVALSAGVLPEQVVYISTTGVYGDCKGEWIDESTGVNPESDRGRRRVAAEQRLTVWARNNGVKLAILRAPGIYALNRLPLDRIRARTPAIIAAEDSWSNHIHASDLARVAVSAYEFLAGGGSGLERLVLNVVDDSQLKMGDYFDLVADHFKLERPPRVLRAEAESKVSTALLSFMRESRRIRNEHLKTVLRFSLNYPTVGDFLAGLAESDVSNRGETPLR